MERYYSYNRFLKEMFGEKIYKISLDGGFTCPNRDGTLSVGGCIFCSEGGSGDYSESALLSIPEQIARGKAQTEKKFTGSRYIAYFQAFTNTYAPVDRLRQLYEGRHGAAGDRRSRHRHPSGLSPGKCTGSPHGAEPA